MISYTELCTCKICGFGVLQEFYDYSSEMCPECNEYNWDEVSAERERGDHLNKRK